jgi:hypothetical protein
LPLDLLDDEPSPVVSVSATTVGARQVTFVGDPDAARPARAGEMSVILDTAWTPGPGDPPEIVPLRPVFATVLDRHDLFHEALGAVDGWAEATGLADRLTVDGVTYWYRLREPVWHWTHERLLWRHALAEIRVDWPAASVRVPASEGALIDVLRALGAQVEVDEAAGADSASVPAAERSTRSGPFRSIVRRVIRRFLPVPPSPEAVERRRRQAVLDARVEAAVAGRAPRVVILTMPSSYQRIGRADSGTRRDPNLGAVIARLPDVGVEPVLVGVGMQSRRDEDWAITEADPRLLPASYIATRWGRPADETRATAAVTGVTAVLRTLPDVPFEIAGLPMTATLVAELEAVAGHVVGQDVRQLDRVERLIGEIRQVSILLTQEGHRTPWLMAAASAGVPSFALQHGVLYPTHSGYADRRHPRLVVPTRTFVFGEYERRVLEAGAYRPDEVAVSGSPRLDLDATAMVDGDDGSERAAVRDELGIAAGDRMLVVSTVHTPFVQRSHLVHMLARCLGGTLPGVHIVIKQHPGERDDGPYRRLLDGLARAGGYDASPMTVVKDVDLYRLLRAADAHLGLHSTVLTDAVVTGTPNLIAIVEARTDILGYVAAGVAQPVHDVDEVRAAMADPRPPSPDARQAFLEQHFSHGDASDRIVAAIRATADAPAAGGPS